MCRLLPGGIGAWCWGRFVLGEAGGRVDLAVLISCVDGQCTTRRLLSTCPFATHKPTCRYEIALWKLNSWQAPINHHRNKLFRLALSRLSTQDERAPNEGSGLYDGCRLPFVSHTVYSCMDANISSIF